MSSREEIPEGTSAIMSRFRIKDLNEKQDVLVRLANEDISDCHSDLSPVEQYMKLEPLFKQVFDNADNDFDGTGNRYINKAEFEKIQVALTEGTIGEDAKLFEEKIKNSKDCFHKSMHESKWIWENMIKTDKGRIYWEQFKEFFYSPKQLEIIEKEGLRKTFLAFEKWEVSTYQQQFKALKSRYLCAFKMHDEGSKGYLNVNEQQKVGEVLLKYKPEWEELLRNLDLNRDGKVTWGEFWHFFSTGQLFATDADGLELAYNILHDWGA